MAGHTAKRTDYLTLMLHETRVPIAGQETRNVFVAFERLTEMKTVTPVAFHSLLDGIQRATRQKITRVAVRSMSASHRAQDHR